MQVMDQPMPILATIIAGLALRCHLSSVLLHGVLAAAAVAIFAGFGQVWAAVAFVIVSALVCTKVSSSEWTL
jgi:hypothetical protein